MIYPLHHPHLLLLFFLALSSILCIELDFPPQDDSEIYQQFQDFQVEFNKSYSSPSESYLRYQIFKSNLHHIFKHKLLNPKAHHGVTSFSDLTPEEFHSTYLKMSTPEASEPYNLNLLQMPNFDLGSDIEFPTEFDWRKNGVNESIESQGICWSCWAFTAVTNIESLYFIKYGEKIKLSEQQLIDCDTENDGCKGGLMTKAYEYIMKAGGLMLVNSIFYYISLKQLFLFRKKIILMLIKNKTVLLILQKLL